MKRKPQLRDTLVVAESVRRSMRGNRSTGTKPERLLRKALWASGLRGYRKNVGTLPGKPDVVFTKRRLAVFVHGCFWHGCPHCTRNLTPKTNAKFWQEKRRANRERDERVEDELVARGYRVLVLWECRLKADLEVAVGIVREHCLP
jgi:DNA mismatch endonuclease, patch repair protein